MTTTTITTAERNIIARQERRGIRTRQYVGHPDRTTMVRSILRHYRSATAAEIHAGRVWYPYVASLLADVAERHGASFEDAAGVFAITSPRCSVAHNMAMTIDLLSTGTARGLGERIEAARAYLQGDRSYVELDTDGTVTTSRKVRSFSANLQGDHEHVTVDVWAMRAAGVDVNRVEQSSGGSYILVAEAYRRAAEIVGETPRNLQAIVWGIARREGSAAGAGDGLADIRTVVDAATAAA